MAEHADDPKHLDLGKLLDPKKVKFRTEVPRNAGRDPIPPQARRA